MTAPPSVQKLTPEVWLDVLDHVAQENCDVVEMRQDPVSGVRHPYCRICETWADIAHWQSEECSCRRQARQITPGIVLAAILEAETERARAAASAKPLGTSKPSTCFQVDLAHGTGTCRKPGCQNRALGRSSRNHCCMRCQLADEHGVEKLSRDPETGCKWTKAHGSECTMHEDKIV